jgi:hypothetical protein
MNNSTIKQNQHFKDVLNSLKGTEEEKKRNFIDLMNTIANNERDGSLSLDKVA